MTDRQTVSLTIPVRRKQGSPHQPPHLARLHLVIRTMDDGFAGIADALEAQSKNSDERFADHEQRITSLEQAA